MKFSGSVFVFGDDIDTDVIIPARHLNTTDPAELATHCMEDADAEFCSLVRAGDIIVAGKNFGCGSSREHAPVSIKAAGVTCVIAAGFARIFYRNAFNTGLILIESEKASQGFSTGDEIEVDIEAGLIRNKTAGQEFTFEPIPPFMMELVADGGLIPHLLKKKR
ncbi:MAG: 3-isopropylmalate dehydratase small subunit [Thermodesulfobacteriota bacterium]|nr:3-isopropylmalate dehydratase small subunit [Thermodesulfobacteriota bacterium]